MHKLFVDKATYDHKPYYLSFKLIAEERKAAG